MTDKYKNKYRIDSARVGWWNYGWNGSYFITICTHHRQTFFGTIRNGEMQLSSIGKIAQKCWFEIPEHFPFVVLGEFVVMSNHVHGIGIIDKPNYHHVKTQNLASDLDKTEPPSPVETQNLASLPPSSKSPATKNQFGSQSKNLASIVRGFKIGATKNARLIQPNFAWQPRYHDHIYPK